MNIYIRYDQYTSVSDLIRKLSAKGIKVSSGKDKPTHYVDWLIHWMQPKEKIETSSALRSYNSQSSHIHPEQYNEVEAILHQNHFRAFLGGEGTAWPITLWPKEYRIYLWDSKVVATERRIVLSSQLKDIKKGSQQNFQWVSNLTEWEKDRLLPSATRALHCLGLDFGKVHIGMNRSNGPVILGIDAAPTVQKKLAQAYADQIVGSLKKWQQKSKLTIGSDPEFMLSLQPGHRMVPASRFFPRQGVVGCDSRRAFGASDDLPLAEVRPEPAQSANEAVEKIRAALREAIKLCPYANIAWVAGSEPYPGYPTGGHIHFGGIDANNQLLRALDQYVALPLLFLENQDRAKQRRQFYGTLGDFRTKSHGFEYRTPGSWISTPELTRIALTLASLVAKNYRNLSRWDFLDRKVQEAFYNSDVEALLPVFKESLTELYEVDGTEETRILINMVWLMYQDGIGNNEKVDLRRSWNLPIGVQRYRHIPRPRHSFSWLPGRAIR
ncbi:putative amidoligase domain-containing protein [Heliorestis convoluta]|uniref:PhiEco32-like amidoligase-type 2 protein n=1 Tax=Heliorestis convoluta TaxID=356322 RepID=A0A5Q2N043_9FIRM|nr:hypothetical protein [Heliorestis convoluta]QGG46876.1 hypothetical protein FTV88_0698 [Heliorestis convoluta]